ncbi:conserved hypothetical protein [Pseudomonas sp. OF001]|jgi:hypothetical protein|uniref:hypothetical protein n=1 Tax=unclassified Pseudomonas TaxID=196821 RepID=UPI0010A67629|nr:MULTISPECIES: hypothetical protein [unclassified Pseudomonas]THG83512.1 hypothetical protein E5198_07365 [Pseudomonas sp. A-1]WPP45592.1 hypothetical protein SK095_20480 [Pseudomonas sp. AN-1]CAD5378594.1 conserved hypothetical protein [Pseudomonas sp. OF001]
MNLNNQHTPEDLAKLFATRKDTHGSHILWISECGEVHLDTLAPELGEDEFEKRTPGMRARLRTYHRGKGYVGKKAAADKEFIGRVYQTLQQEWPAVRSQPEIAYIDRYC